MSCKAQKDHLKISHEQQIDTLQQKEKDISIAEQPPKSIVNTTKHIQQQHTDHQQQQQYDIVMEQHLQLQSQYQECQEQNHELQQHSTG